MLAVLPQPLEVREVGGNSFLEGLAGPALIAVAAIVAAFVAAYVARRNHGEQLESDRAMRDLDHARREIGAAVETISEAVDAVSSFATAAWSASEAHERVVKAEAETDAKTWIERTDDGEVIDTRTEAQIGATSPAELHEENEILQREADATREETEAMQKAFDTRAECTPLLTRMLSDTFRLRISIGTESEVPARHFDVVEAFKEWVDVMGPDEDAGGFRFDTNPGDEARMVQGPIDAFVAACQRWSADRNRAFEEEASPL